MYWSIGCAYLIVYFFLPEQLLELHRGQGKDIYWRDSYICPTEEEYMEMVRQSELSINKQKHIISVSNLFNFLPTVMLTSIETGGLFALAVDLMQLFSDNTR